MAYPAYEGQLYVRDRSRQLTTLASARPDGAPGDQFSHTPRLSPDGRHLTFVSSATDLAPPHPSMVPIYRRDLVAGTTQRLRLATVDGAQLETAAYLYTSGNTGVVFHTAASNLLTHTGATPGDGLTEQLYLVQW